MEQALSRHHERVRRRGVNKVVYPLVERPSPHLDNEVTARVWPRVELQWQWLGGRPADRPAIGETRGSDRVAA
jgi:hypothetical protein